MQEQFKTFKEKIDYSVALLVNCPLWFRQLKPPYPRKVLHLHNLRKHFDFRPDVLQLNW